MPPVISGGALVIPAGLLRQLCGTPDPFGSGDRRAVDRAAMNAVMEIERSLGYEPRDVSMEKRGYDIESYIPEAMRQGANDRHLRFIEVKGRRKGAETVTVTRNEVLAALNAEESFILAIVEVDGSRTHTVYLKRPFDNRLDFAATSANYSIRDLISHAEILSL